MIGFKRIYDRLIYLRNLESRKEDVKRLIDEAGKLTDDVVVGQKS